VKETIARIEHQRPFGTVSAGLFAKKLVRHQRKNARLASRGHRRARSGYCERGWHHPHVHCVVPAGGLAPDHTRWIDSQRRFFLPVEVLSEVFRGKFTDGLKQLHAERRLAFHGALTALQNTKGSRPGCVCCSGPSGWFTRSGLLAARNMRFAISANTLIEWRSRTTALSRSRMAPSLSAGAIPLIKTRSV
jgi:hypothetical protein